MNDNKLYGWDGSIRWQDDFKRTSTSYSQSYIVSMAKYEVPPIDLVSPDMASLPINMRRQSIDIEQVSSTILKVSLSYTFGETVDPEEVEEVEDPETGEKEDIEKKEKIIDSLTSTTNITATLENLLAHPDLRKDSISKSDKVIISLLLNGTLVKKSNGKYGFAKEAYNSVGTIDPPEDPTALEFFKKIEQGVNNFIYDDININYTLRTKYPAAQLKLLSAVGVSNATLPIIYKLQKITTSGTSNPRNWMCQSFSCSYDAGGLYTINVSFKLSNFGGWNATLYEKDK